MGKRLMLDSGLSGGVRVARAGAALLFSCTVHLLTLDSGVGFSARRSSASDTPSDEGTSTSPSAVAPLWHSDASGSQDVPEGRALTSRRPRTGEEVELQTGGLTWSRSGERPSLDAVGLTTSSVGMLCTAVRVAVGALGCRQRLAGGLVGLFPDGAWLTERGFRV